MCASGCVVPSYTLTDGILICCYVSQKREMLLKSIYRDHLLVFPFLLFGAWFIRKFVSVIPVYSTTG